MTSAPSPTTPLPADADPRWAAVLARDPPVDGRFVYAVKTTGVYCRPGSPSRRHASDRSAIAARRAAQVAEACRLIDASDAIPASSELARQAGMSVHHFHRVFKAVTGLTPKAYAAARRADKLRRALHAGGRVTDAIYEAGFNSNSRFYEAADRLLGMRPKDYRQGGANMRIRFAVGQCSLGAILVAQSERGICAILLGDDPDALVRQLQDQFPRATLVGGDRDFERVIARVVGLVEAPAVGLDLPLDVRGTAFQERVWQALRQIPPRRHHDVRGNRGPPRHAQSGTRRRARLRRERPRGGDSLPPCRTQRWSVVGIPLGRGKEARAIGAGGKGAPRLRRVTPWATNGPPSQWGVLPAGWGGRRQGRVARLGCGVPSARTADKALTRIEAMLPMPTA